LASSALVVGQRATEIAIRMAMGAQARDVLGLMLRHATVLIAGGVTIGAITSLMLTPLLRGQLWGVTAADPVTLLLAIGGLALIAVVACYVPARRALKVMPIVALRSE
jgi:ABC-type antimicrobial peptide transport system permease subunit